MSWSVKYSLITQASRVLIDKISINQQAKVKIAHRRTI